MKNMEKYLKTQGALIEKALSRFLPKASETPGLIHEAMRYSALGPGKRIRPILTLAVSDLLDGKRARALIPACAIEMIHNYSLIHDDLPCMDNDDLRRGRATSHKKFSEATATLAGDGLLTEAFGLLATFPDPKKVQRLVCLIAQAAGSRGMIGGQISEKLFEGRVFDKAALDFIHINKTGKLIAASCLSGAIAASATAAEEKRIRKYGECIGFVFQIVDDILDGDGYLKLMSATEAREEAHRMTEKAKNELKPFGVKAKILSELADFLIQRVE